MFFAKFACVLALCLGASAFTRRMYAPNENLYGFDPAVYGRARLVFSSLVFTSHFSLISYSTFSLVNGIGNHTSYAGFFNVNNATDNNLFAW
jgi:hypothetical protein